MSTTIAASPLKLPTPATPLRARASQDPDIAALAKVEAPPSYPIPEAYRNKAIRLRGELATARKAGDWAAVRTIETKQQELVKQFLEEDPGFLRTSWWGNGSNADSAAMGLVFGQFVAGIVTAVIGANLPEAGGLLPTAFRAVFGTWGGRLFWTMPITLAALGAWSVYSDYRASQISRAVRAQLL